MFRAAFVSIVLTLTLGQNVALLCRVWCHPQKSVNSTCEHQASTTSAGVTANESCAWVAAGPTPFVREDAPRAVSGSDTQHGIAVAQFQFTPPLFLSARGLQLAQTAPQEARPLVLPLRI
jgi:hypothetical protein